MDKINLKLYNKYIKRNFYHVLPIEWIDILNVNGINPKSDPFTGDENNIKKLFALLLRLKKKGFVHKQDWGFKKVDSSYIVKVSLFDLRIKLIDFTPDYKETFFYKKHKGGALVTTINRITTDILDRKASLSKNDLDLVKKMHAWSIIKMSTKMVTLVLNGTCKIFETAKFQAIHIDKNHWESPFGSFNNFNKVILKNGIEKYLPFLKNEKKFYLRVIDKIKKSDVLKII